MGRLAARRGAGGGRIVISTYHAPKIGSHQTILVGLALFFLLAFATITVASRLKLFQ